MNRTIKRISWVLGSNLVQCECRILTADGYELERVIDVDDTWLTAQAATKGASTWDESDVAVVLDTYRALTDVVSRTPVITEFAVPLVVDVVTPILGI